MVQSIVKEQTDAELSLKQIRLALRKDCQLGFLRAKKFQPRANFNRCLVQRQQYALEMLKLLDQGKRVINLDETWLNETSFTRRAWAPKDGTGNVKLKPVTPRLSMIAALDSDGRVWFTLSHSTTDSNMKRSSSPTCCRRWTARRPAGGTRRSSFGTTLRTIPAKRYAPRSMRWASS